MPKVTIDGHEVDFDGSHKLLPLSIESGLEIPHFCYHPAMSIPANCRQCLVEVGTPKVDRETREVVMGDDGTPEIQFFPKLMTSCSVDVTDGMVVKTHRSSQLVKDAQESNLEFLLINHPLDCPICDQAGHCPLQIQAYKYGPEGSRFEFRKVHKPKRVELGPRVTLDAERCINCTRCTRFTSEISKSNQLTIISRGVTNYPLTPPGVTFDEPYSMNVIDICPVGALTSTDFRFKARAWECTQTPSITVINGKGSNCDYWVRDNLVVNVSPRVNMEVNRYWLADEDRTGLERFNELRPEGPTVGGQLATWDAAYLAAAQLMKGKRVAFVGSSRASVEDNYLLTRLADATGGDVLGFVAHVQEGAGDDWLRTDDKAPNRVGCERLGMTALDSTLFGSQLAGYDVLYVLEDDVVATGLCSADDLAGKGVILHHYNTDNQTLLAADVTLPAAMVVETVGTFVNVDGHAQRVVPCKAIRGVNRTLMMAMKSSRDDQHGTPFDRWHNESHKIDCRPSWESIPNVAALLGHEMTYKGPKSIMAEVSEREAFAGATYHVMGLEGVRLESDDVPAV
jgi:NADH-quinone oxidoreductase subunit G